MKSLLALFLASSLTGPLVAFAEAPRKMSLPKSLKWCVATSAYQIEGGNTESDLFNWETVATDRVISRALVPGFTQNERAPLREDLMRENCPRLTPEAAHLMNPAHTRQFPNSDGSISVCEFSGAALDHWNRVREDVALIKALGVQQYRMSVEWSRIEPREGVFDQVALQHYADEIRELRANGIEPLVTLFHFSMPNWLRDSGGWENPKSEQAFANFSKIVYDEIGASVSTWFTLNEPNVHLLTGYAAGVLPPGLGLTDPAALKKPFVGMMKAHAAAYRALHDEALQAHREIRVGIAHHVRIFDPSSTLLGSLSPDWIMVGLMDTLWNWLAVDAVETGHLRIPLNLYVKNVKLIDEEIPGLKGTQDFFGLNYYTRDMIQFTPLSTVPYKSSTNAKAVARGDVTDIGWEIYPEGMYRALKMVSRHLKETSGRGLPILISENGLADASDTKRTKFMADHLEAVADAVAGRKYKSDELSGDEPVNVESYCAWTLIDDFEFNSGYFPKYGLYSVDLSTQERTLRPSGRWYQQTTATHQFSK